MEKEFFKNINANDCGYIGGWSIADDKEKEKIIDASNSIPERYLVSAEEIKSVLIRLKTLGEMSTALARPVCRQCELYDYNEMSDEAYCAANDYEPIRLYRKHRPDWCPRLEK